MTLPLYHQDLCELFQRADCPSIFSRKPKTQITLANYLASAQNTGESIRAVKAVIEAILYLRMNLIMPCQLKFEYIVLEKNRWGICHAICDRSEQISKQNDDSYNPQEYIFHLDSQNQLVWHIGKVWLRFFTDTPVKIKHNTQKKVDKLIDTCVQHQQINTLLKRILCLDKTQRIKFEDLLLEEIIGQKEQEQTKFYSSLMVHLKNMSGMMGSKGGMTKFQQKNPFIREINYRRFMEYLQIDMFLENVKRDISKEYNSEDQMQKFNCEFTGYIILLQDYKNMVTLNAERWEIGDRFDEISDRIYYAKFTKRMLILKESVERKGRVLKNNAYMRKNLLRFVEDPDVINDEVVYIQFKTCLSEYAEYLKEDLQHNKKDMVALKLLAKIIIARTSGYIFNQYRIQLFEPLLKGEKTFNIKKIYSKINDCIESEPLRALYSKIQQFYFKN